MTVQTYVVIQTIEMYVAYLAMTVVAPLILFRKRWKIGGWAGKILFSYVFGNFYMMNLVFLLQMLHISNRVTLLLGSLVPWGYFVWKENRTEIHLAGATFVKNLKWLVGGQMGYRKLARRAKIAAKKGSNAWKRLHHMTFYDVIDGVLCVGFLFAMFYEYGLVVMKSWGYLASDSQVHNYWINALSDNDLFVAGIYPQGFHATIYYLHTIFGFETYMLLNFFAIVQTFCLFSALLLGLRMVCRNRFVQYAGVYAFLLADIWTENVTSRFMCALPQEFGMIFILPAAFFGVGFFRQQYTCLAEGNEEKDGKAKRFFYLAGFAMSFAATLMIHFYNTMILAFFCIAMAVGYVKLFVKKEYFLTVVKTCFVGLGIAMAPMVICFVLGTPLEPSLNWGMSVITESTQKADTEQGNVTIDNTTNGELSGGVWINEDYAENSEEITEELQQKLQEANQGKSQAEKIFAKLPGIVLGTLSEAYAGIGFNVFIDNDGYITGVIWIMMLLCLVIGVVRKLAGDVCYGNMQIFIAVSLFFLSILVAAGELGLPTLIPTARAAMYFGFSAIALMVLCLDGLLTLLPDFSFFHGLKNGVAIGMIGVVCGWVVVGGGVREAFFPDSLSTNQAFACTTNILRTEKDFSWTICSADTEYRMTEEHGYHTEILDFLHAIERIDSDTVYEIPTQKVFFFIEKTPIDYTLSYYGSGQQISEPGAAIKLPVMAMGIRAYRGQSRWVCMSKLYYWMQEFMKLYPTDVRVYYEDQDFVCYEVVQEPYHLFNFAIDYRFNTVVEE